MKMSRARSLAGWPAGTSKRPTLAGGRALQLEARNINHRDSWPAGRPKLAEPDNALVGRSAISLSAAQREPPTRRGPRWWLYSSHVGFVDDQ